MKSIPFKITDIKKVKKIFYYISILQEYKYIEVGERDFFSNKIFYRKFYAVPKHWDTTSILPKGLLEDNYMNDSGGNDESYIKDINYNDVLLLPDNNELKEKQNLKIVLLSVLLKNGISYLEINKNILLGASKW